MEKVILKILANKIAIGEGFPYLIAWHLVFSTLELPFYDRRGLFWPNNKTYQTSLCR